MHCRIRIVSRESSRAELYISHSNTDIMKPKNVKAFFFSLVTIPSWYATLSHPHINYENPSFINSPLFLDCKHLTH
jgi:hypothetical protein